jgi:prevent-host-death family protein
MTKFSASEARANFNRVLELAKTEAVEIQKHGKPVAVMVDAMKYEEFLDYVEDLEDSLAVLEIRASEDFDPQTWKTLEEVERDLGLRPL